MDDSDPGPGPRDRRDESTADTVPSRSRRRFVATGLAGVVGLAVGTGATAARRRPGDATVSAGGGGEYRSINEALDDAAVGDLICVYPGSYEGTVVVDVPGVSLHSMGLGSAEIRDGWAAAGPAVSVRADGVTVQGFRVTHPEGRLGISVDGDLTGVTIAQNHVTDVGPFGAPGGTGIAIGAPQSSLRVAGNVVERVDSVIESETAYPVSDGIAIAAAPEDDGEPSENGESSDDAASEPAAGLSDSVVRDNVVRRLTSEYACRGITLAGDAADVGVRHNDVYGLTASNERDAPSPYAWGIHTAGRTDAVTIKHNVVDDVTASAYVGAGVMVRGAPDGLTVTENDITTALGIQNETDVSLSATLNWWGHRNGPVEASSNRAVDDLERLDGKGTYVGPMTVEPWLTGSIQSSDDTTNEYVETRRSAASIHDGDGAALWRYLTP